MKRQELTNQKARDIAHRLSLRDPQVAALELLTRVYDAVQPRKDIDLAAAVEQVQAVLNEVEQQRPKLATCGYRHALLQAQQTVNFQSFQRQFVNLCFALATGVGKTRLMGAFIAWLYLEHGLRHFFVVAPNLTIYRKLIEDFGNPTTGKYVFKGLSEFATDRPLIITGDDYESGHGVRDDASTAPWLPGVRQQVQGTVHINVFNIAKLSKDAKAATKGTEAGKPPRFKRLQDCLGTSYFGYLSGLTDLVMIMDEAHNYRAEAAMSVLDDLKPLLGLELTATPFRTKGQQREWFQNIVYHYQLRDAMLDDLVKMPEVAYRRNLDPSKVDKAELERMKLEDAIALHEETRTHLRTYAAQTGQPTIKPFVLVVAANIEHAKELQATIESDDFHGGFYRGKTVRIDSKQGAEEKAKNTEELLKVERPDSPVEIVLHVESLEEGWDVTNLYTILPLRAADSPGLVLQSIGRGLRLPYGKRALPSRFSADTPERKIAERVDCLTIVSHDRYKAILDEAKKPDSDLTGLVQLRDLDKEPVAKVKPIVSPPTAMVNAELAATSKLTAAGATPAQREATSKRVTQVANVLGKVMDGIAGVRTVADFAKPDVMAKLVKTVESVIAAENETPGATQLSLVAEGSVLPVSEVLKAMIPTFVEQVIEVPRITVIASDDYAMRYNHFTLDLTNVSWTPASRDLVRHSLTDQNASLHYVVTERPTATENRLQDYIVRQLHNYNDVRYEDAADVIQDLADQLVDHLLRINNDDVTAVLEVLMQHEQEAGKLVYDQLIEHRKDHATSWLTEIYPTFETMKPAVYSLLESDDVRDFRQELKPQERGRIKQMVFGGFTKSAAQFCKFDSEPELTFAFLLDKDDKSVARWIRPKAGQLQLRWRDKGRERNYEPDFIVETDVKKWLVEVKAANELNNPEVIAKKEAAEQWCITASKHAAENGGKPWAYKLVPDNKVHRWFDFAGVLASV